MRLSSAMPLRTTTTALRFRSRSGTGFVERQHPTIREMEDIAWVLRTDAKRQRVGFVHAKELRPKERYVIIDE